NLRDHDIVVNIKDIDGKSSTVRLYADKAAFSNMQQRLRVYKALPNRMRPVLEDLSEYVRTQMIPRTFKQEGPGWKPLAKRTNRERIMQGFPGQHPILYRTGDLFR